MLNKIKTMIKTNIIKTIITLALVSVMIIAFVYSISYAVEKQEIVECYKLQKQYSENSNLYKDWAIENIRQAKIESDMCEYHNINIYKEN